MQAVPVGLVVWAVQLEAVQGARPVQAQVGGGDAGSAARASSGACCAQRRWRSACHGYGSASCVGGKNGLLLGVNYTSNQPI